MEFWWRKLKERDQLEGIVIDGRIILKWILQRGREGVSWINVTQNSGKWRAVVRTVMNNCVP